MYEGNVAYVVGEPIEDSGGSHIIQVRLMRRTLVELSVPKRYVLPVYPEGINEKAVITLGEDAGTEGVISDANSMYWELKVQPSDNAKPTLHPGYRLCLVRQEHMVVLGN
jgi:hypothetical protein